MNVTRTQSRTGPCALRLWAGIVLLALFLPAHADAQSELRGKIQDPAFSPSNRSLVGYSRQEGDVQELYLHDASTGTVRQITAVEESGGQGEGTGDFFEGGSDRELRRFEGQLAWCPVLDAEGRQWFAFASSAGQTGYGVFLSYVTAEGEPAGRTVELPFEGQAGFPSWSPDGRRLVFSGSPKGREGNELFMYPEVRRFLGKGGGASGPVKLTANPADNIYPEWSPGGQYIAYQSKQEGTEGRSNWGISLLDLSGWGPASGEQPRSVRLTGQLGAYNEYRPSWSPDGRYVGFYVSQSTVGQATGNRRQDIGVLELVKGSGGGRVASGRVLEGYTGNRVAKNVLPNQSRGPEWHPSREALALVYVAKEENAGNPIYLADVQRWSRNEANFSRRLTGQFSEQTRLHQEVTATRGAEGLRLAFASQVEGSLQLQLQDGLKPTYGASGTPQVRREVRRTSVLWRSAVVPGWGQLRKGQQTRALLFAGAGAVALGATVATISRHQGMVSDYDDFVEDTDFSPEGLAQLPPDKVEERFNDLQSLNDDVESAATARTVAFVALAGVWAWNLYDAYRGFPTYVDRPVYAGESLRVEAPKIGVAPTDDGMAAQFSLRIRF